MVSHLIRVPSTIFIIHLKNLVCALSLLTQWVTHICARKLTTIGSDNGWPAPSQYLNQCWYIVNWTPGNKPQWNLDRNWYIFIQENIFENDVWEMAAIFIGINVLSVYTLPSCMLYLRAIFYIIVSLYPTHCAFIYGSFINKMVSEMTEQDYTTTGNRIYKIL